MALEFELLERYDIRKAQQSLIERLNDIKTKIQSKVKSSICQLDEEMNDVKV